MVHHKEPLNLADGFRLTDANPLYFEDNETDSSLHLLLLLLIF